MLKRTEYKKLWEQLSTNKPMIFITGPRQTGKTTLSRQIQEGFANSTYFNWDIIQNKKTLLNNPYFFEEINRTDNTKPLVILDEIHKYAGWKNYLKGVYDGYNNKYKFLITGSGRLDLYSKRGDSLAGRYLMFTLFPFTLSELWPKSRDTNNWLMDPDINTKETATIWDELSRFSGFPEPFSKKDESFYLQWVNAYIHQIVREEIRNFSDIKHIETVELLYSLLPTKIGSPLSMNSIAGDLGVSFDTVKQWLALFEKVFLTFHLSPWTKAISRSILKEKKFYLFNYVEIADAAIKFENMVALELLRTINYWNEAGLGRYSLHYLRNKDKKEVDFLIANNNSPVVIIETKLSDTAVSKNLLEFQDLLKVPAVQLVNIDNIYRRISNQDQEVIIVTGHTWIAGL